MKRIFQLNKTLVRKSFGNCFLRSNSFALFSIHFKNYYEILEIPMTAS